MSFAELRQDAGELRKLTGLTVDLVEGDSQIFVILRAFSLPDGAYAVRQTDVLIIADQQYPLSALDMFYTEPDVLLPGGRVPLNADSIESYAGRTWRRFSWHRNGVWNPARNGLVDHLALIEARLAQDVPAEAA